MAEDRDRWGRLVEVGANEVRWTAPRMGQRGRITKRYNINTDNTEQIEIHKCDSVYALHFLSR